MSAISPLGSAIRISSPFRRATSSSSYPLPAVFWTIFEVFPFVIWFWILIWMFIDIFRSADLSGLAKALWFLFVLFIRLVGVLVYLIARGGACTSGPGGKPKAGRGIPQPGPGDRIGIPGG